MRSSTGAHFIALDHVRAFAAFLVLVWHFCHGPVGYPASPGYSIPYSYSPSFFPFSILDEGHTGVALFMVLSGYLFAKLLSGKSINYRALIWNRVLRLLPLLAVVILIYGVVSVWRGGSLLQYSYDTALGLIFPYLPGGGWSITVEFHYYLLLPLFLWLLSKSKWWPFSFIIVAIALRAFLFHRFGTVEYLAYWTIIGCIDQFALGMLVYQFRSHFAKKHVIAAATFVAFTLFYWYFDLRGGFYRNPPFPSTNPIWIYLPTIEGAAYAIMIAWYDNSFAPQSPVFQSSLAAWESTRTPSIYSIASLSFAPPSLWMRTSCALATSI